jgi:antitoxin component YwqK of YwqJK toxin-antitoxin module
MKRHFLRYPLASGCVAVAIAMSFGAAGRAEEQGILRVPANLPTNMLCENEPTEAAAVTTEPGVAGEVELVRERYADGKVRIERQVTLNNEGNYVNHGTWKMYAPSGDVAAEGQYTFGQRTGMWTRWSTRKDSAVFNEAPFNHFKAPFMSQASFTDGKLDGDWIITDSNDKKVMAISFKSGQRYGQATTWTPAGKVLRQVTYQEGIPVGDLLEINPKTGEVARTATYQDGRKIVTKTEYFYGQQKKQKQSETVYLAAKTTEQSSDDFWTTQLAKYTSEGSDLKNGTAKTWYANGKPESDGTYDMGKKTGTFTFWHENGQVASTGEYKNDLAEGTWTWWHDNGQKSAIGKYTSGNLIGEWRWWDDAGKLTKQQTYTGTESAQTAPTPMEEKVDVSKRPLKFPRR